MEQQTAIDKLQQQIITLKDSTIYYGVSYDLVIGHLRLCPSQGYDPHKTIWVKFWAVDHQAMTPVCLGQPFYLQMGDEAYLSVSTSLPFMPVITTPDQNEDSVWVMYEDPTLPLNGNTNVMLDEQYYFVHKNTSKVLTIVSDQTICLSDWDPYKQQHVRISRLSFCGL
eukprot:GILJ01026049.1.p1 GENE.GILJ01026049.1~~GILJ01026049.1.p1  ORF type:complete len:168 (+),score=18.92 GILJ01026049.1:73-576(+)